jgi:hypothetical protein
VVWDPLLTRWYGWECDGFGLAYVELYDLQNTFLDHTLGLIQHNWVVLAYNFNVVIWVLIIGEVMYRCISAYPFITILSLLLPCIIILFLHLLSTNPKCTHLCYFPLLLKPAAQKERMDKNSSTRSSWLCVAPVVIHVVLWSLPLFRSAESHHSL